MTEKYKEREPSETIRVFKEKLNDLGFVFNQQTIEMTNNIYSVILWDEAHNDFTVCGKGTTPEYALASAYGEAVERVQCLLFNGKINWKEASEKISSDFIFSPEEKIIKGKDILKEIPGLEEDLEKKKDYTSGIALSSKKHLDSLNNFLEGNHTCIEFYHYNSDSKKYLPLETIYSLQGSNGMCSGNTEDEALIQGLSEVFERWVEEYIYEKGLVPPEIPEEFIEERYPRLQELKNSVKKTYGYDSYMYDCSLGKGVPTVCVIFIDKKTLTYKKSFGAHPQMEIALERCFTEALQTCPIKEESHKRCNTQYLSSFSEEKWNTPKQYVGRFNCHSGAVPYRMFFSTPSWEFKEWPTLKNYSNKSACEKMKELCKNLGFELFYRDFNFLDIPSYVIYIPGVSLSREGIHQSCDSLLYKEFFVKSVERNQILDPSSKELIMGLLENNKIHLDPLNNWVDENTILLSLYVEFRKFDEAKKLIEEVFGYSRLFKCLEKELELRKLSISEKDRDNILNKFFEKEYVDYVKKCWRGENIYLHLVNEEIVLPFENSEALRIVEEKIDKNSEHKTDEVCKNIKNLIRLKFTKRAS